MKGTKTSFVTTEQIRVTVKTRSIHKGHELSAVLQPEITDSELFLIMNEWLCQKHYSLDRN